MRGVSVPRGADLDAAVPKGVETQLRGVFGSGIYTKVRRHAGHAPRPASPSATTSRGSCTDLPRLPLSRFRQLCRAEESADGRGPLPLYGGLALHLLCCACGREPVYKTFDQLDCDALSFQFGADAVEISRARELTTLAISAANDTDVLGVNDRRMLAAVTAELQSSRPTMATIAEHLRAGSPDCVRGKMLLHDGIFRITYEITNSAHVAAQDMHQVIAPDAQAVAVAVKVASRRLGRAASGAA